MEVEDFVLKNVKTKLANKEIPKITFEKDVTVKGNVETSGTRFSAGLKDFMDNRISLSEDATIRQKLIFNAGVTVTGIDSKPFEFEGFNRSFNTGQKVWVLS